MLEVNCCDIGVHFSRFNLLTHNTLPYGSTELQNPDILNLVNDPEQAIFIFPQAGDVLSTRRRGKTAEIAELSAYVDDKWKAKREERKNIESHLEEAAAQFDYNLVFARAEMHTSATEAGLNPDNRTTDIPFLLDFTSAANLGNLRTRHVWSIAKAIAAGESTTPAGVDGASAVVERIATHIETLKPQPQMMQTIPAGPIHRALLPAEREARKQEHRRERDERLDEEGPEPKKKRCAHKRGRRERPAGGMIVDEAGDDGDDTESDTSDGDNDFLGN